MEKKAAIELTKRVKFVSLSTLDDTGFPETRLLFNLRKTRAKAFQGKACLDDDFATYLGTNTSSKKIAQLRKNNKVCLYYSDNSSFEGLALKGTLTEITDTKIKHAIWSPSWEMYYHGGKDGGDYSILLFKPESARYYHGLKTTDFDLSKV